MTRPRPRLELSIDELVLVGFEHSDRHRIAAAVERELAARFGRELAARFAGGPPSPELLARGGADRIDAGSFDLPAGSHPRDVGAHIAGAVHGGLTR